MSLFPVLQIGGVGSRETVKWMYSSWSNCSGACGAGQSTRAAYCATLSGAPTALAACNSQLSPAEATAKVCNPQGCTMAVPGVTCPPWCTSAWGDGICDPECSGMECWYDGGDCQKQLQAMNVCGTFSSCGDCLMAGEMCVWCGNSAKCTRGTAIGPDNPKETCTSGWTGLGARCYGSEEAFKFQPTNGSYLQAGVSGFTARWTGIAV
jgi:hypothetical protein